MKAKNLIRISLEARRQLCKKLQFWGRKVSKLRRERSAGPAFEWAFEWASGGQHASLGIGKV
jgi:hypothetical protein